MNDLPYTYDYMNIVNSSVNPSMVHVHNTGLQRYYVRYLLQKAMSVYKFENIPETWDINYFLYILYCNGHIAVINTDDFGVIPQMCGLAGRNIYYKPSDVVISNTLLPTISKLKIDSECVLIQLESDMGSIMDMINYYADMMALSAETAATNLLNSKLAYVFTTNSKTSAEALKKMYDKIMSGEPAVVIDKALKDDDGNPSWDTFEQNLSQNYIANIIKDDMRKWENEFLTQIGIPNANNQKKERMITDEVNSNNIETISLADLWLENIRKGFNKVNEMFGLKLSVDYRFMPEMASFEGNEGEENEK